MFVDILKIEDLLLIWILTLLRLNLYIQYVCKMFKEAKDINIYGYKYINKVTVLTEKPINMIMDLGNILNLLKNERLGPQTK